MRRVSPGGRKAIDGKAKQAYEKRVVELRAIIDSSDDPAQVAEAREELEKIQEQIDSATGLAGKARRIGDDAKAAASTVGKSIERTLQLLEKEGMPELARHLRDAIVLPSGMSPVYRPGAKIDWVL